MRFAASASKPPRSWSPHSIPAILTLAGLVTGLAGCAPRVRTGVGAGIAVGGLIVGGGGAGAMLTSTGAGVGKPNVALGGALIGVGVAMIITGVIVGTAPIQQADPPP